MQLFTIRLWLCVHTHVRTQANADAPMSGDRGGAPGSERIALFAGPGSLAVSSPDFVQQTRLMRRSEPLPMLEKPHED